VCALKQVAIVQSNYLPWKGYFDLIASVDEFILYDDVQFTRRDWRNRNRIKTSGGVQWLTVPVVVKGRYHQLVNEVEIAGVEWARDHWRALEHNYRKADCFDDVAVLLKPVFLRSWHMLSDLNREFIQLICGYLNIETTISSSSDYKLIEGRSERLADLANQAGATEYISGPAAMAYLDEEPFRQRDVGVRWFSYDGYSDYPQLWGEFVHEVSIVDLLFNCGPRSSNYLQYPQGPM
jgi:hypothetical protein